MFNFKLSLLAFAAISGIGSAFTNVPKHYNGTTYYAVSDGNGHFLWQTAAPGLITFCLNAATYCTIVTIGGYHPVNNVVPNATQANLIRVGVYKSPFVPEQSANANK